MVRNEENMSDYAVRGITHDGYVRFFGVNAPETVQKAIDLHYLSIINSVVMGRLLLSGLLIGAGLKNEDDLLTIRIDGDGPSGVVLVTTTGKGTIKGYVENPQIELRMTDKGFAVAEAVGSGTLSVIRSIGDNPAYTGQIELVSGEIGDDLSYYFKQSEQIDTIVNLGILVSPQAKIIQAGGILVQCMPDTPDELLEILDKNAQKFPNLSDIMDMGYSVEQMLTQFIFKEIPIQFLDKNDVCYKCDCNMERFLNGIKLLGKEEIQEIINSDEPLMAECHFCGLKYEFDKGELT